MQVPVLELVGEFVEQVRVPPAHEDADVILQGLVDNSQTSSSLFKRDMRRLLEKDAVAFLRSACRILKASSKGPGAAYLMDVLWSNPVMVASLIDPAMLTLSAAIELAKRWVPFEPQLDIKLLHVGFPANDGAICDVDIMRAKRVLAIVNELPADRHILLPLVNLLSSPDAHVRSKAAALYGRTSKNADWVRRKMGESDPRVRANAVESLWGGNSASARSVFKEAMRDRHHRVAANSLIGLHYAGADITSNLQEMACASDAMARAAAAFAIGQTLQGDLKETLETLVKDSDPHVRSQALRSLIRIRRHQQQAASEAAATDAAAAPSEEGVPFLPTDAAAAPPEPPSVPTNAAAGPAVVESQA